MKEYRIKDWSQHYENNRTRKMKFMQWLPLPNKHDGDGYVQLVTLPDGSPRPDGAEILGGWVAILQVASKCAERGTIVRSSGHPHDAASIAAISRLPAASIQKALDLCSSKEIGWLEVIEKQEVAATRQAPATHRAPSAHPTDEEWNGTEEKRREENTPLTPQGGTAGGFVAEEDDGTGGTSTYPPGEPGRFTRQHVDAILAAYPRQVGVEGARQLAEYALVEILRSSGAPEHPELWLLDRVRLFAKSWMGQRGTCTYTAKTWFEEKRWKDDPAHWERKRDEVWDTVAEIWFGGSVAPPDQKRVGRIVSALKQHGATGEQIRARLARYKATWPRAESSPEALVKHWARFAEGSGTVGGIDGEELSLFERKRAGESIQLHPAKQSRYDAWLSRQAQVGVGR